MFTSTYGLLLRAELNAFYLTNVTNTSFMLLLDICFTYLIWTVFSVVYSVLCIALRLYTTLCCCFSSVYCTVSACDVRAATLTEVFLCFFLSCKANAMV
jgi:hypothetical protein